MTWDWRARLAANLGYLWRELPLVERIGEAASAGFAAVELHNPLESDPKAVAKACRDLDLALLGVNSSTRNAALPALRGDFRDGFERVMDWCGIAGANAIHILPGAPEEAGRDAAHATFIDNLVWAADLAHTAGLRILLEPLNRFDVPGWFYHQPQEAVAVVAELARGNVGLQFDTYHIAREGLDPLAEFRLRRDAIGHVQIAAAPGRSEPDEGPVDHATFLRLLTQSHYDGWIGCEYTPRGSVEQGLAWRETLARRMETI